MEKTSDPVYPRCIKVNWTIHGGGSDNYYFRTRKMPPPENKELIKMYNDFVNVKDLYEHINHELEKVHGKGKGKRKIKSLKIFRWTSPGASIVSNEDVDDVFREIFEHPHWHQLYENPGWKTREALGKGVPQLPKTVGAEVEYERGPGELMNDLQLFSYVDGEDEDDGDVFLNELLSTEYASKYTQSISSDFGLWFCQHDEKKDKRILPTFKRELPWVVGLTKAKGLAQKMHDTIFKVGKGEAGEADNIKMTEAITNIIIECSKHMTPGEWVDNWEFYPITCSPMQGVEGRPTLVTVNKPMEYAETLQLPKYTRLHINPGLWFMYLLNIARRCLVFKKGKEKRKQYVEGGPKWKDTKDSVVPIEPKEHKFVTGYDCLDPDERRQLYIDINGFCQNIRPGPNRQGKNHFNKVTIDGEEREYNLFNNEDFAVFLTKCAQDKGVKLDASEEFICRIEEDLADIAGGPLSEIFQIVDQKVLELQPPFLSEPDKFKFIKVPHLYKLLFFVIYNASNVEDGIAKEYAFGHKYYQFVGSAEKEKAGKQGKDLQEAGDDRGSKGWGVLLDLLPGYDDFRSALGFVKDAESGYEYLIHEDPNAQKMASGVNTQLVSTFRNKCPFTEGQKAELGFTEWQDGERAYEYFKLAVPYERSIEEEIEEQMILFAPSLVGDKGEDLKEKLHFEIKKQLVCMYGSKKVEASNYKELFEKIYKKLIRYKTITFDGKSYTKTKQGGKKKRRRKKRTRKKRKIKFKWTRKRKKRRKKKIIRMKIKNKTTRNYIKVKKLAKKKRKKRTRKIRRR
ncbi:MAG: hypothetical protein H8E55_72835 [Pelagibacterales bacterium]|nr:hypothetical protein [Pelagibacterales bacterium]